MPGRSRAANSIAAIVMVASILAGMTAHSVAATVHITLFKARHAVEGFGDLFYAGERYRLEIEGIAADSLKSSRSDLAGPVENIHAASDILGTYEPAEPGASTIVDDGRSVRLKSKNGAILHVHGLKLRRQSIDLDGLTIKSRGWGPDAKERAGR